MQSHLKELNGIKENFDQNYGGLGNRYFNKLSQNVNIIHQVSTANGVMESNGSVRSRAIRLADELKSFGLVPNDIILICSKCHSDQTIVVLAALFLAVIIAPLNPDLNYTECLNLLKRLKPKLCFCDLRALKQIERVIEETNITTQLINFGNEQPEAISFQRFFKRKLSLTFQPNIVADPLRTVTFILPTQGTTGPQKFVYLSHQNIFTQTLIFLEIMNFPQKILSFFPLSFFVQTILACVSFEHSVTRILPGEFTERSACKLIHDFQIDCAFLGTYLALKLVDNVALKDFDLSSLKCVVIGCLDTSFYNLNRLTTILKNMTVVQIYGMTETGCIAASTSANSEECLEKHGTVGKIVKNCKVRIVDIQTSSYLEPEVYGELLVKSDGLMLGYFKDTPGTSSSMEKNYFKTGDFVRYDRDGWLYINGRIEDLITINNNCFAPKEIEDYILTHPFVEDVVVIGKENRLLACIIKKPDTKLTEDNIMNFLADELPEKNRPTKIIFLKDFPKTIIGKIKRHKLRNDLLKVKIEMAKSLASIAFL